MEHDPIQTMLDEHAVICKAEQIIENLNQLWETDPRKYTDFVERLIEFFREYADNYHHQKEEQVLFPALKDHPDFVLQEIVDEFEQHHEDFRDYATEAEEALHDKEYEKSYKELQNYLQDLLDHIGAENDELFIMAESLMTEDELETIYFRFKDIDMELGEDRKRELEELMSTLGAT